MGARGIDRRRRHDPVTRLPSVHASRLRAARRCRDRNRTTVGAYANTSAVSRPSSTPIASSPFRSRHRHQRERAQPELQRHERLARRRRESNRAGDRPRPPGTSAAVGTEQPGMEARTDADDVGSRPRTRADAIAKHLRATADAGVAPASGCRGVGDPIVRSVERNLLVTEQALHDRHRFDQTRHRTQEDRTGHRRSV